MYSETPKALTLGQLSVNFRGNYRGQRNTRRMVSDNLYSGTFLIINNIQG